MEIESIGTVKSKFDEPADPEEMQKEESTIIIKPEYEEGLYRIEDNDYLQVAFQFHLSDSYELKAPRRHGRVRGVFASRSPNRPSSIGTTCVELLERQGRRLKIKGLDAVDGTPILDLKPYAAIMDKPDDDFADKKEDPRAEINHLIRSHDLESLLIKAGELHGHFCPYVSLGVIAGAYALDELGLKSAGMEDVVAIVETNSCFSDGVQYATGCSFGNNALIYRDYGKTAVTVAKRDGTGIRLYVKDNDELLSEYPEAEELFDKVIVNRAGTKEDKKRINQLWNEIAFELIRKPVDELFNIEEVNAELSEYAPIFEDAFCNDCGEKIMGPKAVSKEDKDLCISCADADYLQLDGRGLVEVE
ncbi:tRNA (N6-threonylcarbamoyladenosine(37)-N6)-methyltransferase TrmO [Acetohalobium arabaticum]|uniref:Formylmethanofuran dehydrogenase subunit E region n=1 Tax=Acetohalobium arabaticum (strain ATCC 49924 / DSM 5501 / Z-7288) TaxID=574087 RepID=D9QVR4_ACEAZ|nr:tRNA (N6-threonylcarbamoyladenosine(37)-N6)-methyltransferase TrmO [Acetohalobium arabaticum]ADL12323.1 formylmethanofuran dehydrogenase subunit E region [Acetohalobium arabaticum DSM 5501]